MFLEIANSISSAELLAFARARPDASAIALGAITLLSWRIYRFTITPMIYPDDPKELPYWIPGVGHLKSFFTNSSALMSRARLYFNNTREVFSVTAANTRLYVLTKPEDVAQAYRITTTLSFDSFVKGVMMDSGVSNDAIEKMFMDPDPSKEIFPNPFNKNLARLSREMHIHQLFPGDQNLLGVLGESFVKYFTENLTIESLAKRTRYIKSVDKNTIELSMSTWTSDIFANAGQEAYFGKLLREIDPELTWVFLTFDSLTWQVLYQYPRILCGKMLGARNRLIDAMDKYFSRPQSERADVAWFTFTFEDEVRKLDVSNHDLAAMMMTIYWGINTNTRKSAFWMLSYMLWEPELLDAVREETKTAFANDKIDIDYIMNSCPRFKAIWDETIRLTAFSSSVRFITEDTVIGGKVLRKGNRLVIPYRQLHFDESVFGKGVSEFQSERFIKDPGLTRHSSWRPFGGGSTQCPGRFLARQSVMIFVSMVLQRFNIEKSPTSQGFPLAEEGNPVLGLMDLKEGSDLVIRLTPRTDASAPMSEKK